MALIAICCSVTVRADEAEVQEFSTMITNGTLVLSEGSTVGTSDLVTYRCYNTATFAVSYENSSVASIRLPKSKNAYVIISPTLYNVKRFYMTCTPSGSKCDMFQIYLSADGESWEGPLLEREYGDTNGVSYTKGGVDAAFPPGTYYIKICNPSGTDACFTRITYTFDDCANCFRYVEE